VNFSPGPPSPTCQLGQPGCGAICTGYFCEGSPFSQNPDFLDPRNPNSVQNPSSPNYGNWDGGVPGCPPLRPIPTFTSGGDVSSAQCYNYCDPPPGGAQFDSMSVIKASHDLCANTDQVLSPVDTSLEGHYADGTTLVIVGLRWADDQTGCTGRDTGTVVVPDTATYDCEDAWIPILDRCGAPRAVGQTWGGRYVVNNAGNGCVELYVYGRPA
jgi:hypothetical protein